MRRKRRNYLPGLKAKVALENEFLAKALGRWVWPTTRVFCIWLPSWTGIPGRHCLGDYPTLWMRLLVLRR